MTAGWQIVEKLPESAVFYGASAILGVLMGGSIGLILAFLNGARDGSLVARGWAALNRPIRRRSDAAPIARPRRGSKFLPWPWLIGLPSALAIVALAAGLVLGFYFGRAVDQRLARAIADADRDDPNWRFDDLLAHRESIADEKNGALVVAEVVGLLPEGWPGPPPPSPGSPPQTPSALPGAIDRLGGMTGNLRLDDSTFALLRDELDRYREAVQLARTVAKYDRGRHEFEVGPILIDTPLPDTQASRGVARLLSADSAVRAQLGDIDGALESCRAILGVARSTGEEPFLISQLVRKAITSIAFNTIRHSLGQGEASDQALASLQALALDESKQPLLHFGMKGERAMLVELIHRIRTGEIPLADLGSDTPKSMLGTRRGIVFPWGKLSFDNQEAIAIEWMTRAVAISRQPASQRPTLWIHWQDTVVAEKRKRFSDYTSNFPLRMTPDVRISETSAAYHQAKLGAVVILLGAERQRREKGEWPATISSIDAEFLPEVPKDPYNDASYHIDRRDGRFLIYAVGPNRIDDRGKPSDWKSKDPAAPDDVVAEAWDVGFRGQPAPSHVGDSK